MRYNANGSITIVFHKKKILDPGGVTGCGVGRGEDAGDGQDVLL